MSVIRILPEDVSNRIAAGEVIERPASVVKELVENALDAHARRVSITVERGGRGLVQVIDDGCGMDQEDALLCLEAHATSKIHSANDIARIETMGFRGEAVPSIASVSRFLLQTRPQQADIGTEVAVNGGVIQHVEPTGCAKGTRIAVRDLFYNIPARRKFLRTPTTEETHIEETALVLALANPEVGFDLSFDKRSIFSVRPSRDLRTRAAMLLGRNIVDAMLPVDFMDADIRVSGLIAKPGLTRSSRREQRIFVNHRPVAAVSIYYAIRDAYHTLVMKGRYPPVVLFVEVPPESVDVNVHPAKREVRFRNARTVSQVIAGAIRAALQQGIATPPSRLPAAAAKTDAPGLFRQQPDFSFTPPPLPRMTPATGAKTVNFPPPPETVPESVPTAVSTAGAKPELPASAPSASPPLEPVAATDGVAVSAASREGLRQVRIIGEIADLYLVAEGPDGLVLIDQHAAHERILFERMLKRLRTKESPRQGLLLPVTADFSAAEAEGLRRHAQHLEKLGFDIEHFGGNSFLISAAPAELPQENIVGMLCDILEELRLDPRAGRSTLSEERVAQAACKAAVKAHDHLQRREVNELLTELAQTELPYTCPHGRPTMINLSFQELEKRFGRRQ